MAKTKTKTKTKTIKLCSWNVNGIRAVAKKGFHDWLNASGFDIVSVQETKAQPDQLADDLLSLEKYPVINYNSAERKGYSGVANFFSPTLEPVEIKHGLDYETVAAADKLPPLIEEIDLQKSDMLINYAGLKHGLGSEILGLENNPENDLKVCSDEIIDLIDKAKRIGKKQLKEQILAFNSEGRVIESHHQLDSKNSFILFNIYFPNGGASVERLKFKLDFYESFLTYIEELQKINPNIIITGDYNTAHHALDLARPKENTNTSGFMPAERIYLDRLERLGFRDSLRHFNPEPEIYTWWSFRTAARERNVGWRIDYFYVSQSLLPRLKAATVHRDILGSDHCPISIELN